jgi:ribosomal-protein-alanine N-acetyltransferase
MGLSLLDRLWGRHRIRLEPLAPRHAATIAGLHAANFARGWDANECDRLLANANIQADGVFIDDDAEPSGFLLTRIAADEAEILTLCVDAAHRQRGLGRLLIERQVPLLRRQGVGNLFLEVDADNSPALALYRRLGFEQVGQRPGYYARPDGGRALALVMRLAL